MRCLVKNYKRVPLIYLDYSRSQTNHILMWLKDKQEKKKLGGTSEVGILSRREKTEEQEKDKKGKRRMTNEIYRKIYPWNFLDQNDNKTLKSCLQHTQHNV